MKRTTISDHPFAIGELLARAERRARRRRAWRQFLAVPLQLACCILAVFLYVLTMVIIAKAIVVHGQGTAAGAAHAAEERVSR